jgi:hypothetical protein
MMLFSAFSFIIIMTVLSMNVRPSLAQSINSVSNFQPDVTKILISNLIIDKLESGLISITGTVKNNSTETVDQIKVSVTFYNSESNTNREIDRFISGPYSTYKPGSIERFSFIINSIKYDYYTAKAQADVVK